MGLLLPQVSRSTAQWWSAITRALAAPNLPPDTLLSVAVGEPVHVHPPHLESWSPNPAMWTAVELHGPRGAVAAVAIRNDWLLRITQRLLGGPTELPALRVATDAEQAVWAYVVGAVLHASTAPLHVALPAGPLPSGIAARFAITTAAGLSACMLLPLPNSPVAAIALPSTEAPPWWQSSLTLPVAVATALLPVAAWRALALRDVIVVAAVPGGAGLALAAGYLPLRWLPGQPQATVVSRYVETAMRAVPPESTLTLTVTVGTATMSLARLASLAVGEIIELGTPTQGGVELRLAGEVVGRGELVDVDGEMGVRVVALGPKLPA